MNVLNFAIAAALFATVLALLMGLVSMARGGTFNARYGNLFMRLRVGIQLLAVLLIGVALMISAFGWFEGG